MHVHEISLCVCCFLVLVVLPPTLAATWVVDASGSGDFTTFDAISNSKVKPGDTVYLRGTFTKMQTLYNVNGTEDMPITITSYPNTRAIVDGSSESQPSYQGMVRLNQCNYIVVDNILVRSSSQSGISIWYSNNIVIKNCEVHDTFVRAIGGCGSNVVISSNTVYNAVMQNNNGVNTAGGWSQAVSCDACGGANSRNWVFEKNTIYNSWGEGIDCIQVTGCIVRENVVHDTFSVNIYVDNARDILIERNYVYSTSSKYYRSGTPATGILIGAETWPTVPQPTENVTVQNNLVVGTNGIANYAMGSNYVNKVRFYYNTIWNPGYTRAILWWPPQPVSTSGNELKNNIFWGRGDASCSIMGQNSAWTISNNIWAGVSKVPKNCTDTTGSSSIAIANVTDIGFVSGGINPTGTPLLDFLLAENSPARSAGVPLSSVQNDYFDYPRDTSKPSVGFVEYGTQPDGGNAPALLQSFFIDLCIAAWEAVQSIALQ